MAAAQFLPSSQPLFVPPAAYEIGRRDNDLERMMAMLQQRQMFEQNFAQRRDHGSGEILAAILPLLMQQMNEPWREREFGLMERQSTESERRAQDAEKHAGRELDILEKIQSGNLALAQTAQVSQERLSNRMLGLEERQIGTSEKQAETMNTLTWITQIAGMRDPRLAELDPEIRRETDKFEIEKAKEDFDIARETRVFKSRIDSELQRERERTIGTTPSTIAAVVRKYVREASSPREHWKKAARVAALEEVVLDPRLGDLPWERDLKASLISELQTEVFEIANPAVEMAQSRLDRQHELFDPFLQQAADINTGIKDLQALVIGGASSEDLREALRRYNAGESVFAPTPGPSSAIMGDSALMPTNAGAFPMDPWFNQLTPQDWEQITRGR